MSETAEQLRAIAARGNVIVPASAGSGKTFVMVRRYVELVKEGADVRRMLAVTFTNKAAAQMRDRIRRALTEAASAAAGEERERLRRQLSFLPLADICTIHAFCGRVVRTSFWVTGVDPAFRIVGPEDAEARSLSVRALEKTFEDAYRDNADFPALLAVYFRKKKDTRLREMVLRLFEAARGEADYRETLAAVATGREDRFDEAVAALSAEYRRRAEGVVYRLAALEPMELPEKVTSYADTIREAAEAVLAAGDLFSMRTLMHHIGVAPRRTEKTPPALFERITRLRELSEEVKKLYDEFGAYHVRDEERARCENAAEKARALAALALAYDDAYSELKREAGVLDYGDLEHFALKTLTSPEADRGAQYDYLFVDEYQDVNPMQARILSALGGCDVFLVGDKKQAIYGFRGSRSKYFTEKEKVFGAQGGRAPLSANFRSADTILSAANTVFSHVLGEEYEPMRGGGMYGDFAGEVRIHRPEHAEKQAAARGVYSVRAAEARPTDNAIAKKVLAIVEAEVGRREGLGRQWYDVNLAAKNGEGLRDVRYGDIAVLVRKNTKAASPIARALSERGIPVSSSAEVNVLDYFEARILLDWLSYLDNAEQDIPMASAMLSVIGGFSDRELALIRIKTERVQGKYGLTFRAACREYLNDYREGNDPICQKLVRFFAQAEAYRDLARVRTASEMLRTLLADGLEAQIAAKGESAVRLAHVRRLIAESEGCNSIHSFLARLKDCGGRVDFSETGGENAVHIMTIHASKGLEFPIVILTELDERFRGSDHDEIMWTDAYHIAPRCFDAEKKVYGETLLRRAAALAMRRAEVEGERNLLYVAMTRACCRLHLITEGAPYTGLPDDAGRLADFLPMDDLVAYLAPADAEEDGERPAREMLYRTSAAHLEALEKAGRPYAYMAGTQIPVKSSATALMKNIGPMYAAEGEEEDGTMSANDMFDSDMGASFTPEIGTAYHAYLEHVRFGEDAAAECDRMVREGLISEAQRALLDEGKLREILALPVFDGLDKKRVFREQTFLVRFPARAFSEAYGGNSSEDEIVYQGAIDLLVEEGGGDYTVIDYKFSGRSDEEIAKKYRIQLKLYKKTVAKAMGVGEERVRTRIVNIARGRVIEMAP